MCCLNFGEYERVGDFNARTGLNGLKYEDNEVNGIVKYERRSGVVYS